MANYFVIRHFGNNKWESIGLFENDTPSDAASNAAYATSRSGKYTAFDIADSNTYHVEIVQSTENTEEPFED